ncbi:MAG: NYN domain-containing protein [Candidatus Omnitrophica bacterium]|nr:NYN domain-containing protein [Candidatus Omnitrophota bacterium]MDD5487536.1 NYN domain-containing protein [Candidatus Omnitrophota bacterium]
MKKKNTLVVDGYNVIHALHATRRMAEKDLEGARNAVVRLSREFAGSRGDIHQVKVVFDGDDRYRYLDRMNMSSGGVSVFSSTGKGDDKVIEMIRRHSSTGNVTVVSNDNYIINHSRVYGANRLSVEELYSRIKRKEQGPPVEGKRISSKAREDINRAMKKELGL